MLLNQGRLRLRSLFIRKKLLSILSALICLISQQANAVTFNVPATDSDGEFTLTWSGAGTYAQLHENINGSFVLIRSYSGNSGSVTLTRGEGTHTFKLQGCLVTGGPYGAVYNCSNMTKTITISFPTYSTPLQESYSYQYDALGRLVTVVDPNGKTTTYKLDAADNRTKKTVE